MPQPHLIRTFKFLSLFVTLFLLDLNKVLEMIHLKEEDLSCCQLLTKRGVT